MEKIWVKKSSRNEVMNFLGLTIFLEFLMIFQQCLELKITKRGFYALDPRFDVVRRGHLAAPREPTRTHAGPRGRLRGAIDKSG